MVSIPALWLSILLASVLVFVASSIIHTVLPYHKKDFLPLAEEEAVRAALNRQDVPPGQYMIPHAADMKTMREPPMMAKLNEGPVALIMVLPKGPISMGKTLGQWFLFLLAISIVTAYLTSRTLTPHSEYLQVFRVAGTVSWLGYGGALIWGGIWKGIPWSKVWVDLVDALIYALLTAGAFAGFWPR
jgi:hypothetical protein